MVISFHYFSNIAFFKFGWSGVDLFFVLSGFLISSRLIPYHNSKGILQQFYRNRFLRIIPLYFSFLIVFFLVWFAVVSKTTQNQFPFYNDHWFSFFIFIQNWTYIFAPLQSIDHLNHFWSLAVEEQFYILFPLFILLAGRPVKILKASLFLLIIILISRNIYFFTLSNNYQSIYWNSFYRADSFLIGSIIFVLYNYYKEQKLMFRIYKIIFTISVLLTAAGAFWYKSVSMSNPFFQTIGYTSIPIIFGYILLQCLNEPYKMLSRILSSPILRYTGKISYGLYIFHWPVYLFGFGILNKVFKNIQIGSLQLQALNICLSILLTLLISHLSYKYFESFFLRLKKSKLN